MSLGYTNYRCSKCGSDERCGHDATSTWDVVSQTSVLNSEFDDEWCNDCGEINLIEFEITDPAEIARIDAARAKLLVKDHAEALLKVLELALSHPIWNKAGPADLHFVATARMIVADAKGQAYVEA